MRVGNNDQLITLLPLIFWLFTFVQATRHRHQRHGHQLDFLRFQNGFKSKRHAADELTDQPPNLAESLSDSSTNKAPELFKEYMSRGLFECAAEHVATIQKLQRLIKATYEEYQKCQRKLRGYHKTYPKMSLSALDEMMDEWEMEDAKKETN
ncbi:hypothetical protein M3Y98_00131000 [Aphelenchoides besseyi]|nr:hypothetical protein M3Y98_00131000 [Aphelenchoides besseyi]KAI6199611.1 hypothetical protein M3Y96_00645400 [Aphelenchoides besseyi]